MMATDSVSKLIETYKLDIHKDDCLLKILERMNPIIEKYSRKAFFSEYDDMRQELSIAIIEAVRKIRKYDNEGECIQYLANAIRNRSHELYRKGVLLKKEESHEITALENYHKESKDCFIDIEFGIDLKKLIICSSEVQEKIKHHILYEGLTDPEIACKLHISRQYINRSKKKMFKALIKY
ncbi:MAG: hypothetical protein QM793_11885 [Muricomes sp.]